MQISPQNFYCSRCKFQTLDNKDGHKEMPAFPYILISYGEGYNI